MNHSPNSLRGICILLLSLIAVSLANAQVSFTTSKPGDAAFIIYADSSICVLDSAYAGRYILKMQNDLHKSQEASFKSDWMQRKYAQLYWALFDVVKYMLDEPIGHSAKYNAAMKKYQSLLKSLK